VGNSDCVAKTCPNMLMSHKTGYADAVGVAVKDDVITVRVKGDVGLGLC